MTRFFFGFESDPLIYYYHSLYRGVLYGLNRSINNDPLVLPVLHCRVSE